MAELKEGQKIIFKHPRTNDIETGIIRKGRVHFIYMTDWSKRNSFVDCADILEWCDAASAFQAWALQMRKIGNFEWSHPENGPTVEADKI
jgi:hypothetical protein